jgi:hypothetical protein
MTGTMTGMSAEQLIDVHTRARAHTRIYARKWNTRHTRHTARKGCPAPPLSTNRVGAQHVRS